MVEEWNSSNGDPEPEADNRVARGIAIAALVVIGLALAVYLLSRSIYESRLRLDVASGYPSALNASTDGFAEDHFDITFYMYSRGIEAVIRDTKTGKKKTVRGTGDWVWQTGEPDADGVYGHYRMTFSGQSDEYCLLWMTDVIRLCNEVHPNTPPSDER